MVEIQKLNDKSVNNIRLSDNIAMKLKKNIPLLVTGEVKWYVHGRWSLF